MADKYRNFAELAENERPGPDYTILTTQHNGGIVIAAPHGGGIEPGTSEIARAIAGADLSLYLFEGNKQTGNRAALHITSSNFDEPRCLELLSPATLVLTVHGEDSDGDAAYVGGLHESGKELLFRHLRAAGFAAATHPEQDMQGTHPKNICNLGQTKTGLQLELTFGLRSSFFESMDRNGRAKPTPRLAKFSSAVRAALIEAVAPHQRWAPCTLSHSCTALHAGEKSGTTTIY